MKVQCKYCGGDGCLRCNNLGVREETRAEIDRVLGTSLCACGKCTMCQYYSFKTGEYMESHNITHQEARKIVRDKY